MAQYRSQERAAAKETGRAASELACAKLCRMKRRTSVQLDERVYEGLRRRAHAHGRTVSDEIRDALNAALALDPDAKADPKIVGPNQGLLESIAGISPLLADSGRSIPAAASPGFKKWVRDSIATEVGVSRREA
jgi:Ribbon-helix-helix protein, copG family